MTPPAVRHVLHVDTGLTMRGGQWQVLHLIEGLRERGWIQTVLVRGELLDRARDAGFAAEEASFRRVRRAAPSASVIHAHDAHAHTWCAGRHPLVVSRRVAFPVRRGWLSRWKYARADRFLAVSRFVAGRLADAGVDAARIRVVYDGSPPLDPRPCDGTRIVAPDSADPKKGTALLRATGLPVAYSRDLPHGLPGAAVFVYLSHEEGLGSAVLLAQSAGVAVVASRTGGLPEIVEHEVTGLLVENDAAAVRAAVERLLADAPLRQRLAAEARRRFAARYTIARMVEGTEAAYREVLS